MQTKDISGPETSKMVKAALQSSFPGVKFSVRYKTYSMGCSISVRWTDGPTSGRVNAILARFERCGFDGMQDMKTYLEPSVLNGELVRFGADYVQGQRDESIDVLKEAALTVAFELDRPLRTFEQARFGGWNLTGSDSMVPFCLYEQSNGEWGFSHNSHRDESENQLIFQVARKIDRCPMITGAVAVPERVTPELIDETVRMMVM